MGNSGNAACLLFALLTITALLISTSEGWFLVANEKKINAKIEQTALQMPNVQPSRNETYLCTSFPLNTKFTTHIVGFNPIAETRSVHHVLLFACEEPGSAEEVWDCGEMNADNRRYVRSPTCTSQPSILYAWAKGAPELKLPDGVGFRVGGNTGYAYLVLQVHYTAASKNDASGLEVSWTGEKQPKTAATLLLATGGSAPRMSTEQFEAACAIDEPVKLHPFVFRVHTHSHGQKVSGWLVSSDPEKPDRQRWSLLGERDPQLPQLFQPVENQSLTINQGDIVAARCTIKNDENWEMKIGPTGEDEMCNFYLMYWVEGDQVLKDNTCFSPGPPEYYWSRGPEEFVDGYQNH